MNSLRTMAEGRKELLTRQTIREALNEYVATYGEVPTTAAFNPSVARWRDEEHLVERYRTPRADGSPWPSLNAMKKLYGGSFNAALIDAGLPPNQPGPGRRRPARKHAPIRDVRVERVYISGDADERLRRRIRKLSGQLEVAERRLTARADRERVEVFVEDERKLRRVHDRLDAAKRKNKNLAARLRSAERRIERLRNQPRTDMLSEIDRLTARLADAQAKLNERKLDRPAVDPSPLVNRLERRLDSAQARLHEVRQDNAELQSQLLQLRESATADAIIDARVKAAESRAEAAESRASELERRMATQAAAIVGELRPLTTREIEKLRRRGPDGPAVLAKALKHFGYVRAMKGEVEMRAALTELAAAAINYRDRIRG